MNLTIKKKNQLLDYAVERINQYDKFLQYSSAGIANYFMPICLGCTNAEMNFKSGVCRICPFVIKKNGDKCRPEGQMQKTPKEHQDDLIKAVNKWCKKFYLKYKVVRV